MTTNQSARSEFLTPAALPVSVRDARRTRVEAAISGAHPDRVPVSAWGHFYPEEITARSLADTMVDFFVRHDWDYLKVHARASYHVEGWGFRYAASSDRAQPHQCLATPITDPEDWYRLAPLSLETPALAEQFEALRYIRQRVGPTVPLIMTVFSPLDVADKLLDRDGEALRQHLDTAPQAVEHALGVMADTFERFVAKLAQAGVDGIYFSTKWANRNRLNSAQYERFVRSFDLQVLQAARPMWCNILHLCEDAIRLDEMADYPVHVFHWDHTTAQNPGFAEGAARLGKPVGGGVNAATLRSGTPAEVSAMARSVIDEMAGRALLLGPGCSVTVAATSEANLDALRGAVDR